MAAIVTTEQIRVLWNDPNLNAITHRGDDIEPVTKDDLGVLASELDTDDEGYPLDDQWGDPCRPAQQRGPRGARLHCREGHARRDPRRPD
ncbi:hypothetical protein GCM10010378_25530 [Streptomyces viridochromogenes]